MCESLLPLAALKRRIASLEGPRSAQARPAFAFGTPAIDSSLVGGLAYGRLHEIFAAEPGDGSSAAGFALMLAMRAAGSNAPILWLRQEAAEIRCGRLHAPGLAEIGLDPARLILGIAADMAELLKAAADSLRCVGLGAVVIEPSHGARTIDLIASRRLTLKAEQSGVAALLLHMHAEPMPSAAQTRWAVRAAKSTPLPANAPGAPAFDIKLLRQRGGPDGLAWRVEWDRDQYRFREASLSGAVLPLSAGRSAETDQYAA